MKKYIAEVKNNIDPDAEGKVQIYIGHLMDGFKAIHYPWVRQDREFTSFIPEIGDFVWVYFTDGLLLRKGYYQNKVTLKDLHEHGESIGSMVGTYPMVKYIKLKNGVAIALNSELTEASISVGDAEIYINPLGEVQIKGATGSLESSVLGESLKATLEKILDAVISHNHTTAVGPSGPPINASEFTVIKTVDLLKILSLSVKNN